MNLKRKYRACGAVRYKTGWYCLQFIAYYSMAGGKASIITNIFACPWLAFAKPQLYSLICAQAVLARLRNNFFGPAIIKESLHKG